MLLPYLYLSKHNSLYFVKQKRVTQEKSFCMRCVYVYVCIYKDCLHYSEHFHLTKFIDPLLFTFLWGLAKRKIIVLHHHEKISAHSFFFSQLPLSALSSELSHSPDNPTHILPPPSLPQSNVCLNVFMNCHFHGRAVLSFDDMQSNLLARPAAWLDFYQEFVTLQQLYIYTHTHKYACICTYLHILS